MESTVPFIEMSLTANFQEDSYSMKGEPGLCKGKKI